MPVPTHVATAPDLASNHTVSRTTGSVDISASGSDRYGRALVGFRPVDTAHEVTSVLWGSTPMTRRDFAIDGTGLRIEEWFLVNPPAGTETVTFTLSASSANVNFAAQTFQGVHQSTPHGVSGKVNGTATIGAAVGPVLGNATGGLVLDAGAQRLNTLPPHLTMVARSGRTQRLDLDTGFTATSDQRLVLSEAAGAASNAMTWTSDAAVQYGILAVALNPSSASDPVPDPTPVPQPGTAPTPDPVLDRFVDKANGTDRISTPTAGQRNDPWQTISYALSQCPPGRVIWIRGGAYPRTVAETAITKSQTVGVYPYPGETVTLAGMGINAGLTNVDFRGLTFTAGCLVSSPTNVGFYDNDISGSTLTDILLNFREAGSGITVTGNDLHDGNVGVVWQSQRTWKDVVVSRNDIHDLTYTDTSPSDAIHLDRPGTTLTPHQRFLIEHNRIYNVSSGAHADGIAFTGPADDVTIRYNYIFGSRGFLICPPIGSGSVSGGPTGGTMNGRGAITGLKVYGNVLGGWTDFCIRIYQAPGAQILYNTLELSAAPGSNDCLDLRTRAQLNSTVTGGAGQAAYETDSTKITKDVVLVGNIIRYLTTTRAELTEGQFFATKRNNLIRQQDGTYTPGTGDITTAPIYVNAAAGDFRLAGGSAGIDAGETTWAPRETIDGVTRGTSPDMGAYESNPIVLPPPVGTGVGWGPMRV